MFFDSTEQRSKHLELKIKEMCIRVEKIDRDVEALLQDMNINSEEVVSYIENKENFSEKSWAEIQEAKRILNERLSIDLKNIRDPRMTKKALESHHVQPHWIYVR